MITTFTINGIELEVEATFSKAFSGSKDSLNGIPNAGPPLEPDEPAMWEIDSIKHAGKDISNILDDVIYDKIYDILERESEGSDNDEG
jgi:hypothetical protein